MVRRQQLYHCACARAPLLPFNFCIFDLFWIAKSLNKKVNTMADCELFSVQLQSFETELLVPKLAEKEGGSDICRGVFIRAPAILEVGPDVEILADCPVPSDRPSITITSVEGAEVCI
jgi:glutamine amidotransferase PdxT